MLRATVLRIIIVTILLIGLVQNKRQEDKLVLSPVELMDLVREEQCKTNHQHKHIRYITEVTENNDLKITENPEAETERCEDEKTLKHRKVWSRWSKWGDCSVTCGSGVITRHRECVSGRCAPGEREEQRRPCARAPCLSSCNGTDDLHDVE